MVSDKYPLLLKIIYSELGEKTGKVFNAFYKTDSFEEQLKGAFEILEKTIGRQRATDLLKDL